MFWFALFNEDRRFEPDIAQSAGWNSGAYLAEALAHCGDCHTPRNLGFALDNRTEIRRRGDRRAGTPSTSHPTRARRRRLERRRSAPISRPATPRPRYASGPMGEAVDQSFSQMMPPISARSSPIAKRAGACLARARDHRAAGARLAKGWRRRRMRRARKYSRAPAPAATTGPVSAPSHPMPPHGARAVNDPTATNVAEIVISGTVRYTPEGILSMPAFGPAYSDAEIAAVANYVTAGSA